MSEILAARMAADRLTARAFGRARTFSERPRPPRPPARIGDSARAAAAGGENPVAPPARLCILAALV
jgi:hypothetical protein